MRPPAGEATRRVDTLLARRYPGVGGLRARVDEIVAPHRARCVDDRPAWSERDAWLITYPDQFGGDTSLATVRDVYRRHLADVVNGVHLLPCFPWSCDDGYGVVDYESIDQRYGTWDDVEALAGSCRVVLDAVINHLSSESIWFRRFLDGDPEFAGCFYVPRPDDDLAPTVRPRSTPLVHVFEGRDGPVPVWTTFSPDQVDLDYRNPDVVLRMLDVLLGYARRGASAIRLDAVSYLWKQPGTTSINLPESHELIQLLRACVDLAYPDVLLITETNVPHADNLAYLGRPGEREAQAVYQFALPPLALHAVLSGDASALSGWVADLDATPAGTTVFNFLASHDGIGLRPVEGILPERDVADVVAAVEGAGGLVSMRRAGDELRAYELNATWRSAVGAGGSDEVALHRHVATHAVMLALRGIPGVYVHSLLASPNDVGAVAATGAHRSINRTRFVGDPFAALVPGSIAARAFTSMRGLLAARTASDAFHPDADQTVLDTPGRVFGVERRGRRDAARVYVNLSADAVPISVDRGWHAGGTTPPTELAPYAVAWLSA